MFKMRFRYVFMILGSVVVLLSYLLTDPNAGLLTDLPVGADTIVLLLSLAKVTWFVATLHGARRALTDYIDFQTVFNKAMESSEGAGRAMMAVSIIMVAIAIVILAAVIT